MSSPLLDAARVTLRDFRSRRDSIDPTIVNFPRSALLELHRSIAVTAISRVRQLIPFDPAGWDPEAFEHGVWRDVASNGRLNVERIYVLPHRGISKADVSRQIELDTAAGVKSRIVFLGSIPETNQAEIPDGLWLVDEDVVVVSRSSVGGEDAIWTISERTADRGQGEGFWDQLLSWSEDPGDPSTPPVELEEPLVLSADLVHGVSDVLCTSDHVDRTGCGWYHGTWQYLRLLNLVSTPTWHSEFYLERIAAATQGRESPRILITGTADYSMLAYVSAATPADAATDLLDMCATPLFACRWFAKRVERPVGIYEEDLFETSAQAGAYDLICCDAFLTRFGPQETRKVVEAWAGLLRIGGSLVTTVRIHPRSARAREFDVAVRDFRERAEHRARRWRPFLKRSPAEIGVLAETYAARMKSNDLGGEEDVRAALSEGGFQIEFEELSEVPGELYPTTYLRLACMKT
jgi:hypothetical protein